MFMGRFVHGPSCLGIAPAHPSPIHSTSLEMSEVSSETAILLMSVPKQTDTAIFWWALKSNFLAMRSSIAYLQT